MPKNTNQFWRSPPSQLLDFCFLFVHLSWQPARSSHEVRGKFTNGRSSPLNTDGADVKSTRMIHTIQINQMLIITIMTIIYYKNIILKYKCYDLKNSSTNYSPTWSTPIWPCTWSPMGLQHWSHLDTPSCKTI